VFFSVAYLWLKDRSLPLAARIYGGSSLHGMGFIPLTDACPSTGILWKLTGQTVQMQVVTIVLGRALFGWSCPWAER